MDLRIERGPAPAAPDASVEVVERKGRGHPDTICDALAEAAGNALARAYLERFGAVLHHNVDKVLLVGGASSPAFGAGEVRDPMEIVLAGRATDAVRGVEVDVRGIVLEAAWSELRRRIPRLRPQHARLSARIRPGAAELVSTFMRQAQTGVWLANDTSIGVGYAPRSPLERTVLAVERGLTEDPALVASPERGPDVKIMGVRRDDAAELTVADAFVGAELVDLGAYREAREALRRDAEALAAREPGPRATVSVNTADDLARGDVYLTVTGTSAEAGDDGEAGRGNRANGLITPMRPMTMESTAGKNPVSHVGKIYNVVATRIAEELVEALDDVAHVEICLVSRIGRPVREPQIARVRLWTDGRDPGELEAEVEARVRAHLDTTGALATRLARGELPVF
ncbi:MAG TPA: methionine adenosyltransferase [Sandaracinaceae bacterium LLY-WYZ-13_1]|nr:methionine adenosyltransferase [Sandaracinaceae bacterium LLY-WYZ-13_1]